jgi:uncharacterized protein (TIGR00369 family)
MTRLNPAWVQTALPMVNNCPYFRLQSMEIVDLAYGCSRIEIKVKEKHLQPFGLVHGGVFSSLVDAAGWWAIYTEAAEHTGMTTVEMKLNYLAPSMDGRLIGIGQSIKLGKTIGLAEARIENETGRILAHGTVTVMNLPDLKMNWEDQAPLKFVE